MSETCSFCGRSDVPGMHGHHVVPRCKNGKIVVPTCGSCGSFIHATWSHNELRDTWNTVEKIVADERFVRFLKWLGKQHPTAKFRTARNNNRPAGKYR
jgi:5-methylcytosine-specific restriction enzyme A